MRDARIKTIYYRLTTLEEKIDKIMKIMKKLEEFIIQKEKDGERDDKSNKI